MKKPRKTASAFRILHSFQRRRRSRPVGLPPHFKNAANAPQIPPTIRLKISQKINRLHKSFIFKMLHCPDFAKKTVVKRPGFFYCHCQLHRMVPGQTGFALRRVERETRETTNNKPNNIGGTR
jgi:hypothetical protein